MHIALAVFGTRGDLTPMVSLALASSERVERVTLLLDPTFAPGLRERGVDQRIELVEVGEPWSLEEVLRHPRSFDPRWVWREVYLPRVEPFARAIFELHEREPLDAVVVHGWTLGAALACEQLGVPFIGCALQPMLWMSSVDPPRLDALEMPDWLRRAVQPKILSMVLRTSFVPAFEKVLRRMDIDMPRSDLPFQWFWERASGHLALWDPMFRGPREDDPRNARIVGFLEEEIWGEAEHELEQFCVKERPWIVGLGSALPEVSKPIYEHVLDGVSDPVVLIGADPDDFPDRPDRVRIVRRAPYRALFPLARGVIHHGGIGTVADALRAGVPQCVLPFGNDMFDNADCLLRLGVGRSLSHRELERGKLPNTLRELERSEFIASAREVASSLRSPARALDDAVSHILDMAS